MNELVDFPRADDGLRELALFAGAGGGILGGKLLGWRTVCAVEIEPYPASVLVARQNDGILAPFPVWDEISSFDGRPWRGAIDVVSSGFPCQRHSTLGKMHGSKGFDGWPDTRRIIEETGARHALIENVPAILKSGYWGVILDDLSRMGYDARWGVFCCADASPDAPTIGGRLFAVATARGIGLEAAQPGMGEREEAWQPVMPAPADRSVWSNGIPEPSIPNLADGLAGYVGEITATGNGQVPVLAATAWRILTA